MQLRRWAEARASNLLPADDCCCASVLGCVCELTLHSLLQVLAKSSKMIPVMLMGTVLHGKRYSALEYVCCLAISGTLACEATTRASACLPAAGLQARCRALRGCSAPRGIRACPA